VQTLTEKKDLGAEQGDIRHRSNANRVSAPLVSIIVPAYNRVAVTRTCLDALAVSGASALQPEIIVADDASSDGTADLQEHFPHVRVISNAYNVGFIRNCNRAAARATGEFVVFLNNDAVVFSGWLDWLLETIEDNPRIGSVGSKVLLPDGRLSEAGLQIGRDGSGFEYGVFDDADAPRYNYVRDVDCNGGCSLMIRSSLFREIGGFNELYAPAYMDDFELGLAVWEHGYANVYQPKSRVMHVNFVSHGASQSERLYARNRPRFARRWASVLAAQPLLDPTRRTSSSERAARHRHGSGLLAVVDTRPYSGAIRAELLALREAGRCVAYAPLEGLARVVRDDLQQSGIEVLYAYGAKTMRDVIFDTLGSAESITCPGDDYIPAFRRDERWPPFLKTFPYSEILEAAAHA
jgi:GT2 family glycosyltransferase